MVKEIRIYIEGGGDQKTGRKDLRKGFRLFFNDLVEAARKKRIKWNTIACGSRNSAYEDYKEACKTHPQAFNVLLVDSEELVSKKKPCDHLRERDQWEFPKNSDDHCYLMVQTMEAWLIADVQTLKTYYGQSFQENALPKHDDIEKVDKQTLNSSLEKATHNTTKGSYHKIRHGTKILEQLNSDVVRKKAAHCDRLINTITHTIAK